MTTTAKTKVPKNVFRYLVTFSDYPPVPVGQTLVENDNRLERDWTIFNFVTGEERTFSGVRGPRACSECYIHHRKVRDYGHDGEHGQDAPYTPWPEDPAP